MKFLYQDIQCMIKWHLIDLNEQLIMLNELSNYGFIIFYGSLCEKEIHNSQNLSKESLKFI